MKSTTAWLCTAVVVGVVLRFWQAGESLWLDELHTSWTVSGSLGEVAERASIGNQSPLYFWLTWLFARLPLPAEIALRLPSLLAGCALPAAVFWLTKKLCAADQSDQDSAVPLVAAWLVVFDASAIFYSQEARPYALMMFIAVVHVGQLLRTLERDDWRPRTMWVITGALLVHLNYTGGLILLAELVGLVLLAVTEARRRDCPLPLSQDRPLQMCASCWIDIVALIVLLLPAIPGILAVSTRRENWTAFVKPQPAFEMLRMFPWTPAAIVLIVLNSWRAAVSQRNLVLLSCWLLVPLVVTWTTTHLGIAPLFFPRYLIAVLPASLIAAALCVHLGPNATTQSIIVGIVLAVSFANSGFIPNLRREGRLLIDRHEDWRSAVAELNRLLAADSSNPPVLLRSGWIEANELATNDDPLLHEYCLAPVRGMYRLQTPKVYPLTKDDPGKLGAKLREQLAGERSVWLFVRTVDADLRKQLLVDLRESISDEEVWLPDDPLPFGNLYLQRVQLRK